MNIYGGRVNLVHRIYRVEEYLKSESSSGGYSFEDDN